MAIDYTDYDALTDAAEAIEKYMEALAALERLGIDPESAETELGEISERLDRMAEEEEREMNRQYWAAVI